MHRRWRSAMMVWCGRGAMVISANWDVVALKVQTNYRIIVLFYLFGINQMAFGLCISSLYDNFDVVLCLQVALYHSKSRSSTMWACDRLNAVLSSVWHLPKWVKCGRGAKVRASSRLGSNWKMLMTCD